jgi:phage gp29-like protein
METDSTRASATASLDVADDIRDGDARMVEGAVNQLIRWIVELNWPGAQAPVWRLREQEEIDEARPRRDKILTECGVRFSDDYWQRTYDLEPGDLAEAEAPPPGEPSSNPLQLPPEQGGKNAEAINAPPALAEPAAAPDTPTQQTANLGRRAQPLVDDLLATVRAELDQAKDLPTFHDRLAALYPELNSADITELLGQAFAAGDAAGRLETETETETDA